MKNSLKTVLFFLAAFGYASISIANCDTCEETSTSNCNPCEQCDVCPPCSPCEPCCTEVPQTGQPCNCAYNAPARIDPACGWDAWVTGSYLYWQAKEKGLGLGYHYTVEESSPPTVSHKNPINMNFDFHSAFKVGVGFSTERDNWTFALDYTRFNATDSKSKSIEDLYNIDNNYMQSIWFERLENDGKYSSLKSKWELNYNIFDLTMGRPYYLGKKLIFKPHFGIKAGWIDQKYNVDGYVQDNGEISVLANLTSKSSQDSWFIGPMVSLTTDWLISCDFRLFGKIGTSLSYQKFTNSVVERLPIQHGQDTEYLKNGNSEIGYITPNVDLSIGIGYGSYFYNNEWFFDLTIGYDLNYFWNQNFMRPLKDGQATLRDSDAGNLMLHGLNITLRVDF